jgi:hypothetical protein
MSQHKNVPSETRKREKNEKTQPGFQARSLQASVTFAEPQNVNKMPFGLEVWLKW